jgi:hypothetical protein
MKEMTKKLFYPLFAFVVALSLAGLASAKGASTTLKGAAIVDVACSANVIKGGASAADGHSGKTGCATKPGCAKSGYGAYANGKYIKFADEKSNTLAKEALAKATKDTGAKFTVVGEVTGETMTVESITEEK